MEPAFHSLVSQAPVAPDELAALARPPNLKVCGYVIYRA